MKFNFSSPEEAKKIPRDKIIKKVVEGTIVFIHDGFLFKLKGTDLHYPLTKSSYSCKGYSVIYRSTPDEHGRWIKIIRKSNTFGAPSCYIPFKDGLHVKGYFAKVNNIDKFDLRNNEV